MTPHPVEYSDTQKEYIEEFKKQFPERYKIAKGQAFTSVLWKPPADAPHNVDKLYESGLLLKHPSGQFVRP